MADLFKEYESSSSESGDENKGRAQDEMIFESNNVISLSKTTHRVPPGDKILTPNDYTNSTPSFM